MKISVKDFLSKYDFFTLTQEIVNVKVHFFCREYCWHYFIGFISESRIFFLQTICFM